MHTNIPRVFLAICLFYLSALMVSSPALAGTAGDIFGSDSPIKKLTAFMTGPFAFMIVIVGIVIMGGMLIFGNDLSGFGRRVLLLVLGGGLILGSVQVVSNLFSKTAAGALYAPRDIPDDVELNDLILAPVLSQNAQAMHMRSLIKHRRYVSKKSRSTLLPAFTLTFEEDPAAPEINPGAQQ